MVEAIGTVIVVGCLLGAVRVGWVGAPFPSAMLAAWCGVGAGLVVFIVGRFL